jgi:hypothetical protein
MRDFTLKIYKNLLIEIVQAGYEFLTFGEFMESKPRGGKLIILRHDVDRLPEKALEMAIIEHETGVKASYYFRCLNHEYRINIIKAIANLSHEIGYHYETMDTCKGNMEKAWDEFKNNLANLRKSVLVKTICLHGSPRSKWNNAGIWEDHDYKTLGIIGEPYLDIDFDEVFYLTDTGRRWDGGRFNIRDRIKSKGRGTESSEKCRELKIENGSQPGKSSRGVASRHLQVGGPPALHLHSTWDIVKAIRESDLPEKIMLTVHPQRWSDKYFLWTKELVWQNIKNVVKYFVARGGNR